MNDVPEEPPEDAGQLATHEDIIANEPLVRIFGDHPRTRVIVALLYAYPRSLNPTAIIERANIARKTWYNHRDELLETGLVVEAGHAGNSPLYALVDPEDDLRARWLQQLEDHTLLYLQDGRRPLSDSNEQ